MKLFANLNAAYTVAVLALKTIELAFIKNTQSLSTYILRNIAQAMPTVRARALCSRVNFNNVMTLMKAMLNTKFTIIVAF
jgi:hypothetical protein